jgi:hypothetical protein
MPCICWVCDTHLPFFYPLLVRWFVHIHVTHITQAKRREYLRALEPGDRYFNRGQYHLAYLFGRQAASIPKPTDLWSSENVLLRESKSLYDVKARRLAGFAANRVQDNQVRARDVQPWTAKVCVVYLV